VEDLIQPIRCLLAGGFEFYLEFQLSKFLNQVQFPLVFLFLGVKKLKEDAFYYFFFFVKLFWLEHLVEFELFLDFPLIAVELLGKQFYDLLAGKPFAFRIYQHIFDDLIQQFILYQVDFSVDLLTKHNVIDHVGIAKVADAQKYQAKGVDVRFSQVSLYRFTFRNGLLGLGTNVNRI